jgi:hypothetical protein
MSFTLGLGIGLMLGFFLGFVAAAMFHIAHRENCCSEIKNEEFDCEEDIRFPAVAQNIQTVGRAPYDAC